MADGRRIVEVTDPVTIRLLMRANLLGDLLQTYMKILNAMQWVTLIPVFLTFLNLFITFTTPAPHDHIYLYLGVGSFVFMTAAEMVLSRRFWRYHAELGALLHEIHARLPH